MPFDISILTDTYSWNTLLFVLVIAFVILVFYKITKKILSLLIGIGLLLCLIGGALLLLMNTYG
ncbi:MAG: hypothetical protein JW981_07405 [Anaerolineae bacterium]|nr:hypothetical protein [Anaerolineae bacterium]